MERELIRVLVVEDHHVVRQGLVALLNVVDGIEVVGEAADGVDAITQYRKHQPNITLIDLRLPRMGGVDVIQRVRMESPAARFIVLTTYDGDEDIYRALQAGARAYLLKGMTSDELIATIRTVHAGKVAHTAGDCAKAGRAHGHRRADAARVGCAGTDCVTGRATRKSQPSLKFRKPP